MHVSRRCAEHVADSRHRATRSGALSTVRARATTVTLHPGELLFVPSLWWHTARILPPSITVSTNLLNELNWENVTEDMQRHSGSASRLVKSIYISAEHVRHRLSDVIACPLLRRWSDSGRRHRPVSRTLTPCSGE